MTEEKEEERERERKKKEEEEEEEERKGKNEKILLCHRLSDYKERGERSSNFLLKAEDPLTKPDGLEG